MLQSRSFSPSTLVVQNRRSLLLRNAGEGSRNGFARGMWRTLRRMSLLFLAADECSGDFTPPGTPVRRSRNPGDPGERGGSRTLSAAECSPSDRGVLTKSRRKRCSPPVFVQTSSFGELSCLVEICLLLRFPWSPWQLPESQWPLRPARSRPRTAVAAVGRARAWCVTATARSATAVAARTAPVAHPARRPPARQGKPPAAIAAARPGRAAL